jgi:hypothetical protein
MISDAKLGEFGWSGGVDLEVMSAGFFFPVVLGDVFHVLLQDAVDFGFAVVDVEGVGGVGVGLICKAISFFIALNSRVGGNPLKCNDRSVSLEGKKGFVDVVDKEGASGVLGQVLETGEG